MAARDKVNWVDLIARTCLYLLYAVFACFVGFLCYAAWIDLTSGNTEYTVTITGVDGLDAAALAAPPLSPVFDIALRINNTLYKAGERCVGKRVSAVVSYRDALLGKGTVPEFCAQASGLGEATATAWAVDVKMPRFLRDRLAGELERGEAVLDVAVRAPGAGGCGYRHCGSCYVWRCTDLLLDCKANIGGGPSPPCFVTKVDSRPTRTDDSFWYPEPRCDSSADA